MRRIEERGGEDLSQKGQEQRNAASTACRHGVEW